MKNIKIALHFSTVCCKNIGIFFELMKYQIYEITL